MRRAIFIVCLLNLLLVIGALLFSYPILSHPGTLNTFYSISILWSLIMASALVLLSFSVWKDKQVLEIVLNYFERSFSTSEQNEMIELRQKAVDSIMKKVDISHFNRAQTLVDSYRKDGYSRAELVLQINLNEKIDEGLTMEQAIDELYKVRGLDSTLAR